MQDVNWLAGGDAPGRARRLPRPEGVPGGAVRVRLTPPRRRSGARLAGAVVLVLGGLLAGWLVNARAADRVPVLTAARSLPAGHVIAAEDLRVVRVSGVDVLAAVPVTGRDGVVGRRLALPLGAGALLTSTVMGSPAWPPAGQTVVAVAVKPGQAPPMLAAGDSAGVVILPDTTATTPASSTGLTPPARPVRAAVVAVDGDSGPAGDDARTVSLLVSAQDAAGIAAAAAAGAVALVLWAPGE